MSCRWRRATRTGRDIFAERMERGRGAFVDRQEIIDLNPLELGEVFELVEGVDLTWEMRVHDDGDRQLTPRVGSRLGKGCFSYAINDPRS